MKQGNLGLPLLAVLWLGYSSGSLAGERQPSPDEVRFFETRVRPLLAERCFSCHGPEKQKAGLRLDSPEAVRKGGSSGEALLVPARPEASLLLRAVRHQEGAPKMPPRDKLTGQEIADLARWVRLGAPYPPAAPAPASGEHWAFRPPAPPPVPAVRDTSWPKTPLDRFVLAGLEAKGLQPAPPADRRTLIRRATFDLLGLPPTPEEIDAFLADDSPRAFERVVERLLASPHYGERWGRHWLDVARYADSNGLDENVAHGNAWRFRDYVVAAFNEDRPYDQFLLEQVAGDLLPGDDVATRRERLIATGFLALGPKVLAEVDEKKMEMDIVDEQIDTLGRAVLGLTLGCARCHDHKFDPLTTEDYYGLAGIFQSTRTMESFKKVARWHENSLAGMEELARKVAHDAKVSRQKESIQALVARADEQVRAAARPGGSSPKDLEALYPPETRAELKRLRDELARLEKSAPELPSAMGVSEGTVADAPVLRRGNHLTPGKVVPRRFPVVLAGPDQRPLGAGQSGRLELARWLVRKDQPLTGRVLVNRLWRWHFGHGLVRSPDNFGLAGARPDNQPLLDWLACRFVEGGWSVKAVHRLIMRSAAYQMSSAYNETAARADPENRLLWRVDLRRLEAEEIRDSLLAVSGTLDQTMGGSLLHVKNREYLFDHTSRDRSHYDSDRRSLYLPVIRNNLYDVFQLFDATDGAVSSGDRATTTVATQALFLMNGDLVARAAERLAGRLLDRGDLDDEGRVRLLYLTCYGRPPTAREAARAAAATSDFERALRPGEPDAARRRLSSWALLCHVLVAANEFVCVN
jgi:hypothetical protein